MSKRKPHNDTAGYVAERKCRLGGHVMIVDRQAGGDWIDADTRWVVMHLPSTNHVAVKTRAIAYDLMKGIAGAATLEEARGFADILPEPEAGEQDEATVLRSLRPTLTRLERVTRRGDGFTLHFEGQTLRGRAWFDRMDPAIVAWKVGTMSGLANVIGGQA